MPKGRQRDADEKKSKFPPFQCYFEALRVVSQALWDASHVADVHSLRLSWKQAQERAALLVSCGALELGSAQSTPLTNDGIRSPALLTREACGRISSVAFFNKVCGTRLSCPE